MLARFGESIYSFIHPVSDRRGKSNVSIQKHLLGIVVEDFWKVNI